MSKNSMESVQMEEKQTADIVDIVQTQKTAGECVVCGITNATSRCSVCCKVSYCSRKHQKADWKHHKTSCFPMEVRVDTNGVRGRYLVATKPIAQGEIFLKEKPMIWGPSASDKGYYPICLSCTQVVRGSYKCSLCHWPVCDKPCEQDSTHADFECSLLANGGVRPTKLSKTAGPQYLFDYTNLNVLRGLMLKDKHPSAWERLQQLVSHEDARAKDEKAVLYTNSAIKFIQDTCGLSEQFDVDTIRHVSGVIQINAMGSEDPPSSSPFRLFRSATYLYWAGSIATHSCTPNIFRIVQGDGRLDFKALVPIEAGQTITTTYCDILKGTAVRRNHLEKNYYFECDCVRCMDSTEMGTHFSSVKCVNCEAKPGGYLLATNPLDKDSDWKCTACSAVHPAELVRAVVSKVQDEFDAVPYADGLEALEQLESILTKYSDVTLHPNHYLMYGTQYEIIQRIDYFYNVLNRSSLLPFAERQVELCRICLALGSKIWPGFSDHRGRLLYFLQYGLTQKVALLKQGLGRARGQVGGGMSSRVQAIMEEVVSCRQEACRILKGFPVGSDEHKIAKQMADSSDETSDEAEDLVANAMIKILLGVGTLQH